MPPIPTGIARIDRSPAGAGPGSLNPQWPRAKTGPAVVDGCHGMAGGGPFSATVTSRSWSRTLRNRFAGSLQTSGRRSGSRSSPRTCMTGRSVDSAATPLAHRSKNTSSGAYSTTPNHAIPRTAATNIGHSPCRPKRQMLARRPPLDDHRDDGEHGQEGSDRQRGAKMIGTCGPADRRDLDVAVGPKHRATPDRACAECDMRGNDGRPDEHCDGC